MITLKEALKDFNGTVKLYASGKQGDVFIDEFDYGKEMIGRGSLTAVIRTKYDDFAIDEHHFMCGRSNYDSENDIQTITLVLRTSED